MRKLVFLFLLLSSPLIAQNTTIRGRVTMPDGAALPGVTVSAEGTSATAVTDAEGRYSLSVPSRGAVKVTASLQGFQTKSATVDARGAGRDAGFCAPRFVRPGDHGRISRRQRRGGESRAGRHHPPRADRDRAFD